VSGVDDVLVQRVPQRVPERTTASPSLTANPLEPQSADLVRVHAVGVGRGARIAYRFDAQHTAFTAAEAAAEHAYQALGLHRIEAIAVAADGVAQRVQTSVRVTTAQRTGCRCQLESSAGSPAAGCGRAFWAVLALGRRQVRARRNRARKAP
jgi:hypothetical protein